MRAVLPATVVALLAAGVPVSRATVPGANGLLVYEAQTGQHYQLFTVKVDGSGAHQLTNVADSDAVWAKWSPDGTQIVFERDVFTGSQVNRALIETIKADGRSLHALRPTGLNGRPSSSPDGTQIVYGTLQFGKQASLSVMAADGTRSRRLISIPLPTRRFPHPALDSPTFSPDGRRIAFVWIKKSGSAIFMINAGGRGLKRLTPWRKTGFADVIDWSPDGSRIAFSSPEVGIRPGISTNVYTVRTRGRGLVKLTHSQGGKIHNGLDSWSPDGRQIAFVSNRTGTYEIYTMNADGSGVTQITHGAEAHHASWALIPEVAGVG
jgi:TolB protein